MRHRRPTATVRRATEPTAAAVAAVRRLKNELRAAQGGLRQAEAERLLAERRFRSVFNQQFQFMAILSPQGHVIEMSEQLPLQTDAVSPNQIIGRLLWETVWWEHTPEARERWPERLREAALANGPRLSEDAFNSPAGEPRVAAAAITAVKDDAGNVD